MSLGYLQRHQNRNAPVRADGRRYWGHPTRVAKEVVVIGVHTAETTPTVESAEAIARYFTHSDRAASYHEVVDSDSFVTCLPPEATAFGAVGWNSGAWHLSFATRAHLWGRNPEWDEAALRIGAKRAAIAARRFGIPIRRVTLTQAEAGAKGFIDHARLDPSRRSDPGSRFPWKRWLRMVRDEMAGGSDSEEEEDMLKHGDEGDSVRFYQRRLLERDPDCLPEWGDDGSFGDETERATRDVQRAADIDVTGKADAVTMWALTLGFMRTGKGPGWFDRGEVPETIREAR